MRLGGLRSGVAAFGGGDSWPSGCRVTAILGVAGLYLPQNAVPAVTHTPKEKGRQVPKGVVAVDETRSHSS
jgi:hypothetical protein